MSVRLIGTAQVPVDKVASVLLAFGDVPTERRMDVVSTALSAWLAEGGTKPRGVTDWRPFRG